MKSDKCPLPVETALVAIGSSIRIARSRRRQTAKDFADRLDVSLPTLRKLENGDPGVSWGTFVHAMWLLGLAPSLVEFLAPENDKLAASMEAARTARRSRDGTVDLDQL